MAPRERGVVVAVPSGPPVRARGMLAPYVAVGRIFGLTGREAIASCGGGRYTGPYRLRRGTAPHEREYPRRKDRL